MGSLNVRIDADTAAFLERITRQTGRSKSELVRLALQNYRQQNELPLSASPAQRMAHLIGCWDGGGEALSERTGERFARLLQEIKHDHRTGRRRPTRRAH